METTDRLSSWKEIASYLNVDERTCQRWEKSLGLPILRLDASAKSRVFASKAEIDAWMARVSTKNGAPVAAITDAGGNGKTARTNFLKWIRLNNRRRNIIRAGIALAVVVCAAFLFVKFKPRDRVPADFRIEAPFLVITDAAGREIWRRDTGEADLQPEADYRKGFPRRQFLENREAVVHPQLAIGDLDDDGRPEILFALRNNRGTLSGKLILYDGKGSERWTFDTGAEVTVGQRRYPPDFVVDGFETGDIDGDGRKEIVVVSHASSEAPTRILVLGLDASVRGEYWHYGQVSDFVLFDNDRDGKSELLCAGQNNAYGSPCVFLLDPRSLSGASPQDEKSGFEGKSPGSELFYVLLPRTPLARLGGPGQAAFALETLSSGSFSAFTQRELLKFDFGPELKLLAPVVSHDFQRVYALALAGGAELPPLDAEKVAAELTAGIRYYDGAKKAWVNEWARSNPR